MFCLFQKPFIILYWRISLQKPYNHFYCLSLCVLRRIRNEKEFRCRFSIPHSMENGLSTAVSFHIFAVPISVLLLFFFSFTRNRNVFLIALCTLFNATSSDINNEKGEYLSSDFECCYILEYLSTISLWVFYIFVVNWQSFIWEGRNSIDPVIINPNIQSFW